MTVFNEATLNLRQGIDQSKVNYAVENEIIYSTEVLKSNLYAYNNAYILVIGNVTITGHNNETQVAFKICAPFTKCILKMKQLILMLILQTQMLVNLSSVRLNYWEILKLLEQMES